MSHDGDIIGGGIVVLVVEAVGIDEVGVLHTQLPGLGVHHVHKVLDGAAHRLGQNIARLVGRGNQVAVEQLLHREHLAGLNARIGGGASLRHHRRRGGGGDGLVQGELAAVHRLQHQKRGHDLGDGSGVHLFIGVVRIEHIAVVPIHHDGRPALGGRVLQCGGGQGAQAGQEKKSNQSGIKTIFFHRKLPSDVLY